MTHKEFARALRLGLGSAIVELKNNPARAVYRDTVLRYCLRGIWYDWQSEEPRGYYFYTAIQILGEQDYFERVLAEKLLAHCGDRQFLQLASILSYFSEDGSAAATEALRAKYGYFAAKKGRLVKRSNLDEGFQWEQMAILLTDIDGFSGVKAYLLVLGELLYANPNNKKLQYDWFIAHSENIFGKKRVQRFLDTISARSKAIKALLHDRKCYEQSRREYVSEKISLDELIRIAREAAASRPRLSMASAGGRFLAQATEAEISALAQTALAEKDETIKARLLMGFKYSRLFPLDIAPLLDCAQSQNELLSETAIDCLYEYKDERIHSLAIALLRERGLDSGALCLFVENYRKADDSLINSLVKKAAIIPHQVQSDMGAVFTHHRSKDILPALLRIYRNGGDCAYCRLSIVKAMKHCGVLPGEIIDECLYDSYYDTRHFAKQLIKQRQTNVEG